MDERRNVNIFSENVPCDRELYVEDTLPIENPCAVIDLDAYGEAARRLGEIFSNDITSGFVADFERTEGYCKKGESPDLMVHVSTFCTIDGYIYMTYYANVNAHAEDANSQMARLAYCPVDNPSDMTFVNIQSVGDTLCGRPVVMVYDTILMQKDERTVYILWTANIGGEYYRLYRSFDIVTKTLGEISVNRFKVGSIVNDFGAKGIRNALAQSGIKMKKTYSDIGIMQKLSTRVENGKVYYYTGAYSGDFTCIIKSCDLETWEYVSQPDFVNASQWENATYVLGDRIFYFVRQHTDSPYGFLTVYDIVKDTWEKPVLIADSQSRSDFIMYKGELYLFHAPIDRNHIGLVRIDTESIANSAPVFIAKMDTSCFYPFISCFDGDGLAMSYTVERKHIRLAKFDMEKLI